MQRVVVIGSGPSGVACASALLERGCEVLMIDAGIQLESDRAGQAKVLSGTAPADWNPELVANLKGNTDSNRKGIPLKMLFGSDFPYRDAERELGCEIENAGLRPSFARGGFSNVWGAAIVKTGDMVYTRSETSFTHYRVWRVG